MAGLAAHGKYCSPIAIKNILDRDGKQIDVPASACTQAVDARVADTVAAIMAGVIDGPLFGRTGAQMYFGRPAAGKTGTTDSHAAVWFVGFTPDMAGAVWVGDPRGGQKYPLSRITINGRYYSDVFGYLLPGPIWRDSMAGALVDTPKTPWTLNTLFGLKPGGFGSGSRGLCPDMTDEELAKCKAANNWQWGGGTWSQSPSATGTTPTAIPIPAPSKTVAPTPTPTVAPTTPEPSPT